MRSEWAAGTPQPPTDMDTPFLPQLLLTIGTAGGALLAVIAAVAILRRSGSAFLLLLLVGAAICSLNEAPLDIFVSAYYPPEDQWTLYESFGRSVPVWVLFAHLVLFAGAPYLLAQKMKRGSARRTAWLGVLVLAATNTVIELPNLAADHYEYYGNQPFELGGFPMAMNAVNAATMMAITTVILFAEPHLRGRGRLLAIAIPVIGLPAGTYATGLPVFSAVSADLPTGMIYLCGCLSIALALLAIHLMLDLIERRAPAAEGAAAAQPSLAV